LLAIFSRPKVLLLTDIDPDDDDFVVPFIVHGLKIRHLGSAWWA
jgi:hypothetical protein